MAARRGDRRSGSRFVATRAVSHRRGIFFLVLSRVTVGEWFVSGGFFVPDATLQGQPGVVFDKILEGTRELGGRWLVRLALVAVACSRSRRFDGARVRRCWCRLACSPRRRSPSRRSSPGTRSASATRSRWWWRPRWLLGWPWPARRAAPAVAVAALVLVARDVRPLDATAPMIVEAQLDRVNGLGRQAVTACLARAYHGETIFASMGSLAHYMQELSQIGLGISRFPARGQPPDVGRGNRDGGAPFAGWMLVEEVAEGGDVIAQQIRDNPHFIDGYERVCDGGNVALYRRQR